MRAKDLGRLELLGWINQITNSEYNNIESLCDGIAYNQVLDFFYPEQSELIRIKCK